MSTLAAPSLAPPRPLAPSGAPLAATLFGLAVLAAVLAGWVPIQFSIATVFLFAGPHNWLEARYILGRLPARCGKLWGFFLLSFVGIVGLTASFAALPAAIEYAGNELETYFSAVALWNSALVLWIATLVHMRGRTNPRFDAGWVWPLAFLLLAGNWLAPLLFSMSVIYLHPLMALWILDRELAKSRPRWRPAYHLCLLALPVFLGLLWWKLHDAPPLPGSGSDPLTQAITYHAGSAVFTGMSNHLLVAWHTFLEMVHYGVWLLAIPLIGLRSAPWRLGTIPAARRSAAWRRGVAALLLFGLTVVLVLWACFLVDYGTTRHVYFVVAMLHVLAEVPFLLRAL